MMYYRDLTRPEEGATYYQPNAFYVGWLDPEEEEPRWGHTPPAFQDKLVLICNSRNWREAHRGPHECPFCGCETGTRTFLVERAGGGIRYYFPQLTAHYVVSHGYKPPPEFVDAVIANEPIGEDHE
jgi:hypothetical protein